MPLISDAAVFEKGLTALPLATYQAGQTVFAVGSRTGLLLILKTGAVVIMKDNIELATVVEPGAVFGELAVLLGRPHTAEVRALETSHFHVADAATLMQDPISLIYIATILARRLDIANQTLVELKSQLLAGQPSKVLGETVEKIEVLLSVSGANLAYAGYPYDPYA
jgi:CRP/FNR family transcriptional regulator, cyclic AMP receptor protein